MKKFILIWGEWESGLNSYAPAREESDETYFDIERGYDHDEIVQIAALEPGELWSSAYGNHIVFRLV